MSLTFEPIWPWVVVVPAILLLLSMVIFTYPQRVRHLPPFSRRLLIGLRFAAAVVLSLAMLRPAVQTRQTDADSSVVFVVTDSSRSMTTPDGPGGITRRQALLRTLEESAPVFKSLGKDVEVRFFDFAEALTPVETPVSDATGEQTAIGAALAELAREAQNGRLAAVVLMSDGAQRAMPGFDADPRAMARRFGELHVPIYTVAYGGTGVSGSAFDVIVEDLQVDPLAFEKKTVPVTARVRVLGAVGRRLKVRLLVEDRAGKKRGESGEMKVPLVDSSGRNVHPSLELQVKDGQTVYPVELSYIPQSSGEFKIAVDVEPLEGELKQSNNRLETIISVQKGGINIAFFNVISPENKFINLVNRSEKIQLDFFEIKRGSFSAPNSIDPQLFQPGKYDAYIIGDVPASAFGVENLKLLAKCVGDGAGLLMIGGFHNFGAGGYADTPLANFLPVAMTAAQSVRDDEIDQTQQHAGSLQMIPTPLGLRRFILNLDSPEKNLARWQALPPLQGATRIQPKNDFVEVLAETPDGIPLLITADARPARIAAFAGDTTRLWFTHGFEDEHQRFWRQMILWLSRKDEETDEGVWARVDPKNFSPNQPVVVTYGARDAKGQPIVDVDFGVEAKGPDGQMQGVTGKKNGDENLADITGTALPGDYWVRVLASHKGTSLGSEAWTRFIVDARDLELDNPAADFGLLNEISQLTGGYAIPAEQFTTFLDEKNKSGGLRPELTTISLVRLWDNWPFLLVFVTLMSVEWFVRKRRGLV